MLYLRFAGSHVWPTGQPFVGQILFIYEAVCGDQTVEAYSNCDRMRILSAVDIKSCSST